MAAGITRTESFLYQRIPVCVAILARLNVGR